MCSDFEAASVWIPVCHVRVSAQVVEESVQLLCVIDDFIVEIRSFLSPVVFKAVNLYEKK